MNNTEFECNNIITNIIFLSGSNCSNYKQCKQILEDIEIFGKEYVSCNRYIKKATEKNKIKNE